MDWKFWKTSARSKRVDPQKSAGPTTIPEPVARYMVVDLREDAEWVWHLMTVQRPLVDHKHEFEFRVYEANKIFAENLQIRNYASLDNRLDLVILQGTYNRKTGDVQAKTRQERLKAA